MPESGYAWLPREDLLSFEEISDLVDIFADLGVDSLRLTGGEPLLRKELHLLIEMLAAKVSIRDLSLTTNGVLLRDHAASLAAAGLHRITVSLDTLRQDRFEKLTGRNHLKEVFEGIQSAACVGFQKLKLNTLVMRGINDDELPEIIEFSRSMNAEVRFIEYMDVGGATRWSVDQVISAAEILKKLENRYGPISPVAGSDTSPSEHFLLPDGTRFGIIASTTAPFCRSCDRSRLTADGRWYLCLYAETGMDVRNLLRGGMSKDDIGSLLAGQWQERSDHGAEDRLEVNHRGPLYQISTLHTDPHLEMHTRGG